jgi:transposase-like protein
MIVRDVCPGCGSPQFKKNGHIHSGKQNHRCKICGRQFVASTEDRKKLAYHSGALKYFICHYNLAKAAALPV